MSGAAPRITRNRSDAVAIARHLAACSGSFVPPLETRVGIADYSDKLARRAERFEAWEADRLVGLVAIYCPEDGGDAFVSNVSTLPDRARRGIAQSLLAEALAHARQRARTMSLQVDRRAPALALYRRLGFEAVSEDGDTLTLRLHFASRSEAPPTPSALSERPNPS
ncbi:GNAT family N-acetyltransferase [Methylobacterium sp. SD21]|uniref:GNAT family N-acetyltransferase n=1 Tax=Methylobacterium litchii TaxID=3138810 RepID=UPI00313EF3B9